LNGANRIDNSLSPHSILLLLIVELFELFFICFSILFSFPQFPAFELVTILTREIYRPICFSVRMIHAYFYSYIHLLFVFSSNWVVLVKLTLFYECMVCYPCFLLYRKSSLNDDTTHCIFMTMIVVLPIVFKASVKRRLRRLGDA
jgi:hypothetical protein